MISILQRWCLPRVVDPMMIMMMNLHVDNKKIIKIVKWITYSMQVLNFSLGEKTIHLERNDEFSLLQWTFPVNLSVHTVDFTYSALHFCNSSKQKIDLLHLEFFFSNQFRYRKLQNEKWFIYELNKIQKMTQGRIHILLFFCCE